MHCIGGHHSASHLRLVAALAVLGALAAVLASLDAAAAAAVVLAAAVLAVVLACSVLPPTRRVPDKGMSCQHSASHRHL